MKAGYLDLPIIWRGCYYPAVVLVFSDEKGHPLDLTGWSPQAWTPRFNLKAHVIAPGVGRTRIGPLTEEETSQLRLGIESWDWVWVKDDTPFTVTRPMLQGKVPIKEAVTDPENAP